MDSPLALSGLLPDELVAHVAAWGEPTYRAKQIFRAVQAEGHLDPHGITTLPLTLRERIASELASPRTTIVEAHDSDDGTQKLLMGLPDGKRVEAVLIPEGERLTLCVSTQVGCPIACVFCASGVGGLVRNLEAAEIVEQVLHAVKLAGRRPTNVVLMGMGEPLLNFEAVERAIRIWTHADGQNFSPRRITVSSALTPVRIDRLADAALGVNLAVSLHAPNDEVRAKLVPGSPAGRTQALVDAAARYARKTGRDATVEYVLIAGENDKPAHAEDLARLVGGRHIHVNLIPLNPVGHRPDLRAPPRTTSEAFAQRIRDSGCTVTLRTQRGDDIAAACGQLALERALGA